VRVLKIDVSDRKFGIKRTIGAAGNAATEGEDDSSTCDHTITIVINFRKEEGKRMRNGTRNFGRSKINGIACVKKVGARRFNEERNGVLSPDDCERRIDGREKARDKTVHTCTAQRVELAEVKSKSRTKNGAGQ
jgi:hypothetical protein